MSSQTALNRDFEQQAGFFLKMYGPHSFTDPKADFGLFQDFALDCDHREQLRTEENVIQCKRCLSRLMILPEKPGEFRLEWLSLAQLAAYRRRASCG